MHYVIARCVLNKFGNFSCAKELKQYIMSCVINQKPLNVPYLVMQTMANVIRKDKTPFPYAFVISKIIRAYHIYPFEDEEKIKAQEIVLNTMSNLGYMMYQNQWVKKPSKRRRRKVAASGEEMEEQAYDDLRSSRTT